MLAIHMLAVNMRQHHLHGLTVDSDNRPIATTTTTTTTTTASTPVLITTTTTATLTPIIILPAVGQEPHQQPTHHPETQHHAQTAEEAPTREARVAGTIITIAPASTATIRAVQERSCHG
jgi:hypothetical protein